MVVALGLVVLGLAAVLADRIAVEGEWMARIQGSFVRLFSLDQEANLPTWFASMLLLAASGLALVSGLGMAHERRGWTLVAAVFLVMSIDEAAVLHEMLIVPMQAAFELRGLLYYGWMIPAGLAALAVAGYLLPFVWRLPPDVRGRLVLAGAVYLGGALGVEAVTGAIEEARGRDLLYHLLAVLEESLELAGVLIAVSALLRRLERLPQPLEIRFEHRQPL